MLFDVINLMDCGSVENAKIVCFANGIINFPLFQFLKRRKHLLFFPMIRFILESK